MCNRPFSYEPTFFNEREIFPPTLCQPCEAVMDDEEEKKRKEAREKQRHSRWESICPEEYRGTDIHRLPKHYQLGIHSWRFGAKGIAFVGAPGIGKTRAAFEVLLYQHFRDIRCYAIRATRFGSCALEKFDNDSRIKSRARDELHQCHTADILLLDDLGKGKFTDRAEEELYDTLELRTSKRRPTIWTANSMGPELLSKFSADRGEAILRRLGSEFCDIL